MKSNGKTEPGSITAPQLKTLLDQAKANFEAVKPDASAKSVALPQPDLYQDAGGGYNRNFVFPQE